MTVYESEKTGGRAQALMEALAADGTRAVFKGPWLFDRRPLSNLAEVLGMSTHGGLSNMMLVSGVDPACVTGGASDYDKLEALFGVLPLWSGHPYYVAISEIVKRLTGQSIPLSAENLPRLWRETAAYLGDQHVTAAHLVEAWGIRRAEVLVDREELKSLSDGFNTKSHVDLCLTLPDLAAPILWRVSAEGKAPDMAFAMALTVSEAVAGGCGGVAVDLAGYDTFLRPDPYRPAQAVLKLRVGEALAAEERGLIAFQALRLLGDQCVHHGLTLYLQNVSDGVLAPLCRYLRGCRCLPTSVVITTNPRAALAEGLGARLLTEPTMPPEALEGRMTQVAAQAPIGCLGGLHMPLAGILDLPLWEAAVKRLCAWVAELGTTGRGTDDPNEQLLILKRILS